MAQTGRSRALHPAQAAASNGCPTPLEYMLAVVRGEVVPGEGELQAAIAAAPYLHAWLARIDAKLDVTAQVTVKQSAADEIMRRFDRLGPQEDAPERLN